MNERIKQLAEQADYNAPGGLWKEYFAELIIRECAELATKEYNNYGGLHGNDLLEHFGVE